MLNSKGGRPRRDLRVDATTPAPRWPEFLTLAEVAVLLHTSEKTIRRMVASGELQAEKLGRLRRIRKATLLGRQRQ